MIRLKHIVFRMLFLLTVLICSALEVYTYNNIPVCNTELSSNQNYEDNSAFSDVDPFEDEHINQTHVLFGFDNQQLTISISKDTFLLIEFSFSNWKPPKYS